LYGILFLEYHPWETYRFIEVNTGITEDFKSYNANDAATYRKYLMFNDNDNTGF